METILIAGGSGMIGSKLCALLVSQGYKVIVLTRQTKKTVTENISYALWNPQQKVIDSNAVAAADHIIHIAGANVGDKRWTEKRKKEIIDSRVDSSATLVQALSEIPNTVQTVISASAIGWYGPDKGGAPFIETDPPADNFLGETCRRWEDSVRPVATMGKRLVILRTAIVFDKKSGAFPELTKTLKFGIASILGSGKQVISWIHTDDICRLYLYAIQNPNLQGVYNAAAPEFVTNEELVLKAARVRNRPFIAAYVPAFVLKMIFGEMSIEVLKSTTIDDDKIRREGFKFIYPSVDAVLNELMK